jgi:hypothetical protein
MRVDPALEWLRENLITLSDVATRGYPIRFVAVHDILDEPARIGPIYDWAISASSPPETTPPFQSSSPPETTPLQEPSSPPKQTPPPQATPPSHPTPPPARAAAIASVEPQLARRSAATPSWISPEHAAVLDRLYAAMRAGDPLTELDAALALEAELATRARAPASVWRAGLGI